MTALFSATLHRLDHFRTLVATGPEAKSYLQGQLSFDLDRLGPERMELATCNSAQGRVQAVVWLVERNDGIVMVLPTSMLETTLARLRKYVLRAKVKLEVGASRFQVYGASDVSLDAAVPQAHREIDGRSYLQWPGLEPRILCVADTALAALSDDSYSIRWRRADIAAGLPQVYPQTHEAFVAQMLNVDVLGGIGFEKGCYTGQEIIARTHYRGAIKRRMLRYRAAAAAPAPGTRVVSGEQHAGDVVDAVVTAHGCELLAVVNLAQADAQLALDASRATLERLPLPYQA
jgi:tRNA-modifying protein YgfZ